MGFVVIGDRLLTLMLKPPDSPRRQVSIHTNRCDRDHLTHYLSGRYDNISLLS